MDNPKQNNRRKFMAHLYCMVKIPGIHQDPLVEYKVGTELKRKEIRRLEQRTIK
jgi:hypothetical protein